MSEQMADLLRSLQDQEVNTAKEAIAELRNDFGDKTSGILAQAFGVTQRTGERWIAWATGSGSQASDPTRYAKHKPRIAALINLLRNRRAAKRLRKVRFVKAGKVRVLDKSPRKGRRGKMDPRPRDLGTRPVSGTLATGVQVAADLVEAGEYDRAASVMDDALLEAYGVPAEALEIESYLSDPEFWE